MKSRTPAPDKKEGLALGKVSPRTSRRDGDVKSQGGAKELDPGCGTTEGLEARLGAGDHDDLRLWLRIMTIHKQIAGEVRKRFREQFDTSLARFDLMANLVSRPEGIRMGSLSDCLMVTSGNITQLVDHLQQEDLVERSPDPTSRRAWLVRLTPRGRAEFRAMAQAHERWMRELFAGLTRDEKKLLLSLLGKERIFLEKASVRSLASK